MMDTAPAVVERDLACVGCGYNLRAVAVGGSCPECAAAVQQSIEAGNLGLGDPAVRQRIRGALSLILASLAMTLGAWVIWIPLLRFLVHPGAILWAMWILLEHLLWALGGHRLSQCHLAAAHLGKACVINATLAAVVVFMIGLVAVEGSGDAVAMTTIGLMSGMVVLARLVAVRLLTRTVSLIAQGVFHPKLKAHLRGAGRIGMAGCVTITVGYLGLFAGGNPLAVGLLIGIGLSAIACVYGIVTLALLRRAVR